MSRLFMLALLGLSLSLGAFWSRSSSAVSSIQVLSVEVISHHPEPTPLPEGDYQWFLSLVESGIELPHDLIRAHTLIAQPYGRFEGVEVKSLGPDMRLFIIRQIDVECVRHFLLTGNQHNTLDQALLAQQCQEDEGETEPYLVYRFKEEGELEQLRVVVKEDGEEKRRIMELNRTFRCTASGEIHIQPARIESSVGR